MSGAVTRRKPRLFRAGTVTAVQKNGVLLLLSVGFLSGALLGGFFAGKLSFEPYIAEFLQESAQAAAAPSLWRELWVSLRWPTAVLLVGMLPWAGLTMPTVLFLRGFLLSCGIGAVAAGRGLEGILWAGLLFGPTCALTVPVMFVLGTDRLLRKAVPTVTTRSPLRFGLCAAALALCVVLDLKAVPAALHKLLQVVGAG